MRKGGDVLEGEEVVKRGSQHYELACTLWIPKLHPRVGGRLLSEVVQISSSLAEVYSCSWGVLRRSGAVSLFRTYPRAFCQVLLHAVDQ